eukprot:gene10652-biopygen7789
MEQSIINSSVTIDVEKQVITAYLLFIDNPALKLSPNKAIAFKTYYQQLRKLDNNPSDKADIIALEAKLQQLGFVDYVHNLSEETQLSLQNNVIQNFIPWRAVRKVTSLSTPCRVVFDASLPTPSGYSLNDILAKGSNNLNKLQEVLIRWSIHKIGIHTDIRKMYNTIQLNQKHWCYQRYIWQNELDSSKIPKEKIIKTLIYGIRSSGNQAEHGLREIANMFKEEHPEVHRIVHKDIHLMDEISLNISELNFAKRCRGKKPRAALNVIPDKLTRRQCVAKVAEIYDLTGKIAPLVASMKLDLQDLCRRQLAWDDILPDELHQTWLTHFKTMNEIGNLRYKRAIVPEDAVNMDIETLDFGDASQSLSKNMIADLGTRRGVTIEMVNQSSTWVNGFDWMHLPSAQFPTQSVDELKFTEQQLTEMEKEKSIQVYHSSPSEISKSLLHEMKKRYEYSEYLLDPMKHSFAIVIRIIAYVIRFSKILVNRIRGRREIIHLTAIITPDEVSAAENYYFKKGSKEVIHFLPKTKYDKISSEKNGILLYTERILPSNEVSVVGKFTEVMKDLSQSTFCVPILERFSPIAYSISLDVHWNHVTVKHSGIETTHRYVLKKVHVIEGRMLMKHIRNNCDRCRYLAKRTVEMAMGPVSPFNLTIAPAFYCTQLDISGPYQSFSPHHKRTTVKIWLIVFCCCATSAVKIKVMDDYTTTSFVEAFTRFSNDHGYPKRLLCDEGSQLVKGCKEMHFDYLDIRSRLMKTTSVEFDVCPVQGHNMHGKFERKTREVNSSIKKNLQHHRLSLLQWETLVSSIGNQINNLPLAVGDVSGDFECLDLITPNRLLLGRNNERCPDGLIFCDHPTKILTENEKVFNFWLEVWLLVHVPKLMKQSEWFDSDSINVGDVILFTKQESSLSNRYTYGIVKELEYGEDKLPRKAKIMYRNGNESVKRETYRSVRKLVVIHPVDECDFMTELGMMAKVIDFNSSK